MLVAWLLASHSPSVMSYDPEHFTTQSNKAVQAALDFARERGHIELHPLHLAYVLFSNESSLAAQLAQRAGVTPHRVIAALEDGLRKLSRQEPPPADIYPNPAFIRVLKKASAVSKEKKDSHTSIDSLLLALYEDGDTQLCLDKTGLTRRKMEELIQASRGNQGPVTSASAENTYDALKKYAMDLVAMAEDGKLDPVIGRDGEIRRCIQVLSRRTKNNPVLIGEPGVSKHNTQHTERIDLDGTTPTGRHCPVASDSLVRLHVADVVRVGRQDSHSGGSCDANRAR